MNDPQQMYDTFHTQRMSFGRYAAQFGTLFQSIVIIAWEDKPSKSWEK